MFGGAQILPGTENAALLTHISHWPGRGGHEALPFPPYCSDQAPGEKPSPPALQLPTPPTKCAGWSCRAHGDHIMTLLTWPGQRGTESKME